MTQSRADRRVNSLLISTPNEPLANMAIDNWLARYVHLEPGAMIVRIYAWDPPAITIGRNQNWNAALDLDKLQPGEIAVRRITGGRALYHDSAEITYSVAYQTADRKNPEIFSPSLAREVSGKISDVVAMFLRSRGVPATVEKVGARQPALGGAGNRKAMNPKCFESVARYEICAGGQKVAVGAQRILGGRFFQHGSIKPGGDISHPALFSRFKDYQGNKLTTGDCSMYIGSEPNSPSLALAIKEIFEDVFDSNFSVRELTVNELKNIQSQIKHLDFKRRAKAQRPPKMKSLERQFLGKHGGSGVKMSLVSGCK